MNASTWVGNAAARSVALDEFRAAIRARLGAGARLVTFYGRPSADPAEVILTAVVAEAGRLEILRTSVSRERGYHTLTRDLPPLHIFERELYEQLGVQPHDHPWLKPVRFEGASMGKTASYPFYKISGKEVHEVGVGPIHAGVIEPGHFRFMCLGETVHHLEIQLGYQHRAAESLLLERDARLLAPVIETIAGDSTIAHAWAYCDALEALAGVEVPAEIEWSRAIALELERVAMHLAGLAGMSTDIAFLQGGASYGRLRTTAINTSMLLCGSRFGRGWLRPASSRAVMTSEVAGTVQANLALLRKDVAIINEHFLSARSVQHRLQGVGTVTRAQALELGLVGMAARSCGLDLDARTQLQRPAFQRQPVKVVTEPGGDCWGRARLRIRELDESLGWLDAAVKACGTLQLSRATIGALAPDTLAISVAEGWRGEVVHCLETDGAGKLLHYKVQDPSLRNWFGLALAVRNNEISDFPICNKSFDLSYCGNDL